LRPLRRIDIENRWKTKQHHSDPDREFHQKRKEEQHSSDGHHQKDKRPEKILAPVDMSRSGENKIEQQPETNTFFESFNHVSARCSKVVQSGRSQYP
jgi:hypothetical protein